MNDVPFRLRAGNVLWQKGIQPYLFKKNPEEAHEFTIKTLQEIQRSGLTPLIRFLFQSNHAKDLDHITLIGGVAWRNEVGLAAGFDKHAEVMAAVDAFGFGAQGVGTVVPQPQEGNKKPRVFRYPRIQALVNRYGFNSVGAHAVAENIAKTHRHHTIKCPIGVSLGKNKNTPDEQAVDDYVSGFRTIFPVLRPHFDYMKLNWSSPNTPGLRAIFDRLDEFLAELRERIDKIMTWDVPLYLKIPPDNISSEQYERIVETSAKYHISALEGTNTTTDPEIKKEYGIMEEGGVSGEPLRKRSTEVLQHMHSSAKQHGVDLIGVGGISNADHALEKLRYAKAIQIYTGLVFRGPLLIHEILEKLHNEKRAQRQIRMPFTPGVNVRISS